MAGRRGGGREGLEGSRRRGPVEVGMGEGRHFFRRRRATGRWYEQREARRGGGRSQMMADACQLMISPQLLCRGSEGGSATRGRS